MEQPAMRGTKAILAAVIVMGVLILVGTTALVVIVAKRMMAGDGATLRHATAPAAAQGAVAGIPLHQPAGSHVGGIAVDGNRAFVTITGAGPDRILVVDLRRQEVEAVLNVGE